MQDNKENIIEIQVTGQQVKEKWEPLADKVQKKEPKKKIPTPSITSFPTPRRYDEELLITQKGERVLAPEIAKAKEELMGILSKKKRFSNAPSYLKESIRRGNIYLADEIRCGALIPSLSRQYNGSIMDRVLRALPEILYLQNIEYNQTENGLGLKEILSREERIRLFAWDGMELFANEESESSNFDARKAAIIRYNPREIAKVIYGCTKPQHSQVECIREAIDFLANTPVFFPTDDGSGYFYRTLINKQKAGYTSKENPNIDFELMQLAPIFTCALLPAKNGGQKGKEALVWHIPTATASKVLGSSPKEWRLLAFLEYKYSFAYTDVKKAAAEGRTEKHIEKIESVLTAITTEEQLATNREGSRNRAKLDKEVTGYFANMVKLGLIKEGTFKREGTNYIWEWGTSYLLSKKE